jgi:hypothetical protein
MRKTCDHHLNMPGRRGESLLRLCVFAIFLWLPACNIVGPAVFLAGGLPKVEAQHTLADVPTLVFIDDRENRIRGSINLRRTIAETTSRVLMDRKLVTRTISPNDAMTLATQRERNSRLLSIEEIGTMVGARQVVYVEMTQFQNSPDGYSPRPTAACSVRVIDLDAHQRVFPAAGSQETSRQVRVVMRPVDPEVFRTRSTRDKVHEELAVELGQEIAMLFYEHEVRELGGNLNPR